MPRKKATPTNEESSQDIVVDQRKLPIYIHSQIDDLTDLTPNAMRVYMHLARRASKEGSAWPSYQSIGDHCFTSVSDNAATRKSFARRALDELLDARLIVKEARARADGGQTSNRYILVDPVPISTPHAYKHPPVPIGTKGTPVEDTPIEETNTPSNKSSTGEVHPSSSGLDQDVDFGMGEKGETKGNRASPVQGEDSAWQKERDREWENIPSAMASKPLVQGSLDETNAFARQYKLLDGAPDKVRRGSFLVFQYTGFKPTGTKQSWLRQINDLWQAAEEKEALLVEGLLAGETSRQKNGLTYSGPRGYLSFVRNAAAKPVKTVLRRSHQDPNRLGQTVRVDKQGITRVRVNA